MIITVDSKFSGLDLQLKNETRCAGINKTTMLSKKLPFS